MKISGDWITQPGTQALCAALQQAGHKALFVGGCVRNAVLGVPVTDIDLATDATPETVSALAETAGFRAIPTGVDHGTVTVIADGIAHEVTTFRRDLATDGRHATVAYTGDIAADAARRDFTMNALYADSNGSLIDPIGGLPDLLARQVRFVGNPKARITEDYLRILRFFRFHAHFGDPSAGIDAEGLAACATLSAGIETLSKERIGAEMRKLLAADDPAPAVASMAAAGVLAHVLPGADTRALAPLVDLEPPGQAHWLCRLAVLGGENVAEALRLSRAEATRLAKIREMIGATHGPAPIGFLLGAALGQDALLARAAVLESPLPADWQDELARGAAMTFPVHAADLIDQYQGPALGARLSELKNRWLASDLRLTRAQLLA